MCGIIGYTGNKPALKILLNGLSKLEYRGYDSAGIAFFEHGIINIIKSKGKIEKLISKIGDQQYNSKVGIGHTRWATHGEASDINSHPHFNKNKTIAVVHNGIIENYMELKKELIKKGYEFISETDSEVIAHLLDYYKHDDFLSTIKDTVGRLEGSYALAIINLNEANTIYAVRNESPLIIGKGANESFIASDVPAILEYTNKIYYLDNKEIAKVNSDTISFYNSHLKPIVKELTKIEFSADAASKSGYAHFMLKEIIEQPEIIKTAINANTKDNLPSIKLDIDLTKISKVYIVACGTAYNAGLNAKYLIERLLNITAIVEVASEFRYNEPLIDASCLVIIISQSGETADTLAALRLAKEKGAEILSIVNVVGSSIARESNNVIYTWAGPEMAVASTKAYTSQLAIIYLLVIHMSLKLNKMNKDKAIKLILELKTIPNKIKNILEDSKKIKLITEQFKDNKDAYFIGRGLDYYVALEGSLKLKEISYVHAEAYPAGELKHGTIALIDQGTLVVGICTNKDIESKMISNIKEVITRGAKVIGISNHNLDDCDTTIILPETNMLFKPLLTAIPLQLFAYYMADIRGCEIDKPKNLAKSVTVE